MIVTVNNKEYEIRWRHGRSYPENLRTTNCMLYEVLPEAKNILSSGLAICVATDNFCKETGRKISLTRALRAGEPFGPAERQQVWKQYFARDRGAFNAQ